MTSEYYTSKISGIFPTGQRVTYCQYIMISRHTHSIDDILKNINRKNSLYEITMDEFGTEQQPDIQEELSSQPIQSEIPA